MSKTASKTKKSETPDVNAADAAAVLVAIKAYWAGTNETTAEALGQAIDDVLAGKRLDTRAPVEHDADEETGDSTT